MQIKVSEMKGYLPVPLEFIIKLYTSKDKDSGYRSEYSRDENNNLVIELFKKSLSNIAPVNTIRYPIVG